MMMMIALKNGCCATYDKRLLLFCFDGGIDVEKDK